MRCTLPSERRSLALATTACCWNASSRGPATLRRVYLYASGLTGLEVGGVLPERFVALPRHIEASLECLRLAA